MSHLTGVPWLQSPDCGSAWWKLFISPPGEESLDKVQIILCGQIRKHVGARHSGIVSLSESYFPYVGGIPDLRILHPNFIDFFFFSNWDNTTNDKEQYQPGF